MQDSSLQSLREGRSSIFKTCTMNTVRTESPAQIPDRSHLIGPIVRVSPSHVAIADPELVHQIHKNHAQYPKSRFYTDFTSGIENTFSMRDIKKHAERRRLLGSQMTESALKTLEPLVSEKVEKAVAKMRSEAEANSGVVDVQKWSYCMSGDILGQLSFNEDFGLLEAGKVRAIETSVEPRLMELQKTPFLKAVEEINMRALPAACFPSLNGWLGKIPGFRGPKGAVSEVLSHARRVLRQYAAMTDADPQAASRQPTFFSKFLGAQSDGTLTEQQVIEEANNAIIAGTDTTAITLSYMIWLIAQDADLQEQLATDLENVPLTNQKLKAVPLVEHILDETLRLYGAAPGMLPRDVPEQGTQMGDYFIPQDMTVITQPWTMHRNEDIFDEADEFLPYRWEAPTPAMRDSFMPFGGGVRGELRFSPSRLDS